MRWKIKRCNNLLILLDFELNNGFNLIFLCCKLIFRPVFTFNDDYHSLTRRKYICLPAPIGEPLLQKAFIDTILSPLTRSNLFWTLMIEKYSTFNLYYHLELEIVLILTLKHLLKQLSLQSNLLCLSLKYLIGKIIHKFTRNISLGFHYTSNLCYPNIYSS